MQIADGEGAGGVRLALHRGVVAHDLGLCRATILRLTPEGSLAVYPDGGSIAVQFHVSERAVGDVEVVPDAPTATSLPSNISPTHLQELPDPYGSYVVNVRQAIVDVYGVQVEKPVWRCSHDVETDDGTKYVFTTTTRPALDSSCIPDSIRLLGDQVEWNGRKGTIVDYHQCAPVADKPPKLSVQGSDGEAYSVELEDVSFVQRGDTVVLGACRPDSHAFDGGVCSVCNLSRQALAYFAGQSVVAVSCQSCGGQIPERAGHDDVWGNAICDECWSDYSPAWGRPVSELYSGVAFHDPICGWFDTSPPRDRECPDCGEARIYPVPEIDGGLRCRRLE